MKYEVKFTNQFKKYLKLAKKQNIVITVCPENIAEQENVILNRIGFFDVI